MNAAIAQKLDRNQQPATSGPSRKALHTQHLASRNHKEASNTLTSSKSKIPELPNANDRDKQRSNHTSISQVRPHPGKVKASFLASDTFNIYNEQNPEKQKKPINNAITLTPLK